MTLQELKTDIINNSLSDDLLVLVCEENTFLANQYIDEISAQKCLSINKINSLNETSELSALSLVFDFDNHLNVLRTDIFDEKLEDYSQFKNTIVVCSKVSKEIEKLISDYTVKMTKLEPWHVEAYAKLLCPELSNKDIEWLYNASNKDIYKVLNELDKITIFAPEERYKIFAALKDDRASDLYVQDIFTFIDAIIKKDKITLLEGLRHKQELLNCLKQKGKTEFDPIGISTLLLTKAKQILFITKGSHLDNAKLGLSDKQAWAIKKNYSNYSETSLIKMIDFLSKIDLRLKSHELDFNNNEALLDYIICGILAA